MVIDSSTTWRKSQWISTLGVLYYVRQTRNIASLGFSACYNTDIFLCTTKLYRVVVSEVRSMRTTREDVDWNIGMRIILQAGTPFWLRLRKQKIVWLAYGWCYNFCWHQHILAKYKLNFAYWNLKLLNKDDLLFFISPRI